MKNLLYIFADQWKKTAIGFEGESVPTPNIDAFAADSLIFDNAISTYPLCSPHRAALLTGKHPYNCGMWTNCKIGLDEVVMLKPQEKTIANVLKDEGYATAYIGKWHLDASEMNFEAEPESGARHWDAYTPEGERRQGFDYWYSYGAMDKHLKPHYWQDSNKMIINDKWSPELETDVALRYLEDWRRRGLKINGDGEVSSCMGDQSSDINLNPFCMFVSWNPPHPPYDMVPEKYVDRIEELTIKDNVPEAMRNDSDYLRTVREYYGAIAGLDDQFGRIMAYLKENNLLEDTLIVLSADHGDMMGSHGLMGKNVWYEESIQIPLMMYGRGIDAGRSDVLFASMDHMPTLLDLLDVKVPETVQGRSFKECIVKGNMIAVESGKSTEADQMTDEPEETYICMMPGMPELIEPFRQRGLNNKAFGWRGVRTKNETYVIHNGLHPDDEQKRYLYDLIKDPLQMNPVMLEADNPRSVEYDTKLRAYCREIQDPFLFER